MRWLAVFLAGLLLAPAASAQFGAGPYVGLGYGVFQIDDDGEQTGINFSDTAASYRFLFGYNIHETLAVELGLGKSAGFSELLVGISPNFGAVELDAEADYDVKTLRVLAMAPFSGVDMFGGIGFYDGEVKYTYTFRNSLIGEVVENAKIAVSGATLIGGVQFHLDRLIIRGEYEWFDGDKGVETSALNIALILPFGKR